MLAFAPVSFRLGLSVAILATGGLLGPSPAHAQQADGRWQAHTSLREVTALATSADAVWAATSGGVFRYTPAPGELQAYTASDGLHSIQTQAVAYDARRGVVWIGYRDGVLDRLDPETGAVQSFRDIARADRFTAREIHRLVVHGDSLLVATSFGLVVFDPVRGEVRDTYSQLGTLATATPVYDVLAAPVPEGVPGLWLATGDGVAYAAIGAANLQDPRAWTVEQNGLPSREVRALAPFRGTLYAGTAEGLAVRRDDGTFANTGITTFLVQDLVATGDVLLGAERFGLVAVSASGEARRVGVPGYEVPTSVVVGPDGMVWLGDRRGGLAAVDIPAPPATQATVRQADVYPDGPFDNAFSDLAVDASGNLWAAGALGAEAGFYRRDAQGRWTNYVPGLVPELGMRNSFMRVYVDAQGSAWAGSSAGGGLVQVPAEGPPVVYDERNSSLRAPVGEQNSSYVLVGGVAAEPDGTLWVTNRAAADPLHVRTPDGEWTGLAGFDCEGLTMSGVTFDRLMIDSFGQKWIIVLDRFQLRRVLGVAVLDTRDTPTDGSDDACRFFGTKGSGGQDLPATEVTSIVEDRDGTIWIGTTGGLAFVINSGVVANDRSAVPVWPQFADRSEGTFLLFGAVVNDLAVDPANGIWVATQQGAYLVRQGAGGYTVERHFTEENSPLFSNSVVAVTVWPQTGRVFFATDRGLISYEGEAVAPAEQAADLLVYPNPVRLAEGSEPSIFIEGLVEATELRILAPHGTVVARMESRGGRIRWDGRDAQGSLVPSGVYLVVAVGQNGEGTVYGKVAVIR